MSYSGCPNAIAFFEGVAAQHQGFWQSAREAQAVSQRFLLSLLKNAVSASLAQLNIVPEKRALAQRALLEIDHPDFRLWLAGKLKQGEDQ
jgi:hypothetical protein